MFCPKCGNQLPDNGLFCTNCGNPLEKKKRSIKIPVIISVAIILGVGMGYCSRYLWNRKR